MVRNLDFVFNAAWVRRVQIRLLFLTNDSECYVERDDVGGHRKGRRPLRMLLSPGGDRTVEAGVKA